MSDLLRHRGGMRGVRSRDREVVVNYTGNFRTTEKSFTQADVDRLARSALKRCKGDVGKAQRYASNMADRYESYKWEQVADRISEIAKGIR